MKQLLTCVFVIFFFQCISAQTLLPTVKQHSGIQYNKLNRIDTLLQNYVDKHWLVGSVVLIVKDNQVVYHKANGYSNFASKTPMKSDAIFRIMSQTKGITSFAIMQLLEQGKLYLDQPISDFIPEFKKPKLIKTFNATDSTYTTMPAKREITFRDLLTHTSGIGYPASGTDTMKAMYAKNNIPSGLGYFRTNTLAKIKELAVLPLKHNPGEKYTYGLSTDVLGCLIEVISGLSLEAYFQKNIFEPLGMKETYFNVPTAKVNRLPTVYTENNNHEIIEWSPTYKDIDPSYPLMQKNTFSGGSGLSAATFDYAIFLQMLLNGGKYNGQQLLGRRTLELMLSPQLGDKVFGDNNFCLGFEYTTEKTANLKMQNKGTFSWGGYYGSYYWADPKEKLICLIMTQHTPNSHKDFVDKITNIIYASLK